MLCIIFGLLTGSRAEANGCNEFCILCTFCMGLPYKRYLISIRMIVGGLMIEWGTPIPVGVLGAGTIMCLLEQFRQGPARFSLQLQPSHKPHS